MISQLAIAMAISFWTPFHDGQPVCPQGVHIAQQATAPAELDQPGTITIAWTYIAADDCEINAGPELELMPVERQCAFIAHELGHNVFGLQHSDDPRNVMFTPSPPTPGGCRIKTYLKKGWVR